MCRKNDGFPDGFEEKLEFSGGLFETQNAFTISGSRTTFRRPRDTGDNGKLFVDRTYLYIVFDGGLAIRISFSSSVIIIIVVVTPSKTKAIFR